MGGEKTDTKLPMGSNCLLPLQMLSHINKIFVLTFCVFLSTCYRFYKNK